MDDILLPCHIIDRLKHRWAARLQRDAETWSREKDKSVRPRHVQSCGTRRIPATLGRSRRASYALRTE
jgi:hypothetical protein